MTLGWWILAALAAVAAAAGAEAWIKRGRRRPLAEMIERSRPAGPSDETRNGPRAADGPASRMPWLMPMSGRTADSMIARPHASWTADEDQKTGPKAPTDEPNQTSEVER